MAALDQEKEATEASSSDNSHASFKSRMQARCLHTLKDTSKTVESGNDSALRVVKKIKKTTAKWSAVTSSGNLLMSASGERFVFADSKTDPRQQHSSSPKKAH